MSYNYYTDCAVSMQEINTVFCSILTMNQSTGTLQYTECVSWNTTAKEKKDLTLFSLMIFPELLLLITQ